MILVDRHTTSGDGPFRATLKVVPSARIELTDVRGRLLDEFGDDFARFRNSFYISDHTTAGYLDQRMAEMLDHDGGGIEGYLKLFQELFPPGADYVHDDMRRRDELTEEQKVSEPLNADSHLTFIGAGLHNSASYQLPGSEPVWFVELDGVHLGGTRQRRTTVIAYDGEEEVTRVKVRVPASSHPLDAQNLRDPELGVIDRLQELIRDHGVAFGRIDVSLPGYERDAGLTVNEYEALLMNYDLRDAISNPLAFMARTGRDVRSALRDPRTIPTKAVNFAQFDAVQVLNLLLDRVGLRDSLVARVVNRAVALPVSHFLRMKRSFSLPVLDREGKGRGEIGWGVYQSPILVQWKAPDARARVLDVKLLRFR